VLVPSVIDRGFVGDVMVSVLFSHVVDRGHDLPNSRRAR
jgi:hypothetical protein